MTNCSTPRSCCSSPSSPPNEVIASPIVRVKRTHSTAITPNTIDRHREANRKINKKVIHHNNSNASPSSPIQKYYTESYSNKENDDSSPASTVSSPRPAAPLTGQGDDIGQNDYNCPVCCEVLVRPVDVCDCGHHVCRKHVIDMITHSQGNGFKCPLCRKEVIIDNYNDITVDEELKAIIKAEGLYDDSRRSSWRSSRSGTPLQERFNREFFEDETF